MAAILFPKKRKDNNMNSTRTEWTLGEICTKIKWNQMVFARYPRWNRKQMSMFIDSIILNMPVPDIYTIMPDRKDEPEKIIDGISRINAVAQFMNNAYALEQLKTYPWAAADLNGLTFDKMPESIREYFSGIKIGIVHLAAGTDNDKTADFVSRLNTQNSLSWYDIAYMKMPQPGKELMDTVVINTLFGQCNPLFSKYMGLAHNTAAEFVMASMLILQENLDDADLSKGTMIKTAETFSSDETLRNRMADLNNLYYQILDFVMWFENRNPQACRKFTEPANMLSAIPTLKRCLPERKNWDDMITLFADFLSENGTPMHNSEDIIKTAKQINWTFISRLQI